MSILIKQVILSLLIVLIKADENSHHYQLGENIVIWYNKIGPYSNPQENYHYDTLGLCRGEGQEKAHLHSIGEAIEGHELVDSLHSLQFKIDVQDQILCEMTLDKQQSKVLRQAIENQYWTLFYIDELPVWGVVGETVQLDEPMLLVYTHKKFQISYNSDQIIQINYTNTEPVPIEDDMQVTFKYSIN